MTQEFKDHIVQHPNRFKRVPVPGKADEFDMIPTWQENPSEVVQLGTPVDRQLFEGITSQLAEIALSVKRFGVKGDGVTDDTAAIQAAVDAAPIGATLLFPDLGDTTLGYKTSDSIVITKRINVIMDSPLHYAGPKDRTALRIAPPGTDYLRYLKFKVGVISTTNPTIAEFENVNFKGIVLENMINCDIEITHARRFSVGANLIAGGVGAGELRGFAWNDVKLGHMSDNREGLVLQSVGQGWPNANVFRGGSFGYSGGYLSTYTGTRASVVLRKSTTYGSNTNVFHDLAIEGGRAYTQGKVYCFVVEDYNRHINVQNCRLEDAVPNDPSRGAIVYMERPTSALPADIKVSGVFTHAYPKVVTPDGRPLVYSDCQVVEDINSTLAQDPWHLYFKSDALIEHYLYGVNNGQRYTFDNLQVFSSINGRVGNISYSDAATNPMNTTTKKISMNSGIGVPCIRIAVTKGDHFKLVTDGRYIIAAHDTAGLKMNLPTGQELITTRNGYYVRFGSSYVDYFQSDVIGKNETEIIIDDATIGYLIIAVSDGASFFDVYRNKLNAPNSHLPVTAFKSTALPPVTPPKPGIRVERETLAAGTYTGWVSIGTAWKGYGMIEA